LIISKLTSKAQTTIPRPVREALRLQKGDEIAYSIEDGRVVMTKAATSDSTGDPFRTFSEWSSDADRRAYRGL
jgi:antitoxin PrlF